MDAVRGFNNELSALYECKPPISKAKMTSVTRAAIKAIKFYKHVVQSVEKFVQKCRPEYKVPGLYVVDSIVRQSRHQFGADKDVFAPRFAKNINAMFQNLFKCPPEEKSRIVRVLNLWQKNNVFNSEVIQPLLDMANPNHPVHQQSATPVSNDTPTMLVAKTLENINWATWLQDQTGDPACTLKTMTQLLQHTQQLEGVQPVLDANFLNQLQQITSLLSQAQSKAPEENAVKFNKKLLDFDYGDEDDEDDEKKEEHEQPQSHNNNDPAVLAATMAQNLLSNPDLLRQLQQMQQTIQQTEALRNEMTVQEQLHKQRLRQQEEEFTQQIQAASQQGSSAPAKMEIETPQSQVFDSANCTPIPLPSSLPILQAMPAYLTASPMVQPPQPPHVAGGNDFVVTLDQDDRQSSAREENDRDHSRSPRRRDRSRSRSRTPSKSRVRTRRGGVNRRSRSRSKSPATARRRRSRSRSGSRSRNRHRRDRDRRSRSRDREREREREREKEKEREREKERKRRGLPPIKKDFLCVCSTTLWLGHVSKLVSEEDLADTFGEYGDIVAIDMIPPRGCAFVCMNRRQDAYRALQKLKNLKLQGKQITMAWAPGKGVKGKDYKDYWDVDLGVSYIPLERLPENVDMDGLEDGGMIDEDTIPEHLKLLQKEKAKEKAKDVDLRETAAANAQAAADGKTEKKADDQPTPPTQQQPQQPQPPLQPPPSLPILPPMGQPQFGLPGLLPGQPMPLMPLSMSVPPPAPMMMVPPVAQSLLGQPVSLVGALPQSMVTQPFTIPTPAEPAGADDATPTQESQDNSLDGVSAAASGADAKSTATVTAATVTSIAGTVPTVDASGIPTSVIQVSAISTPVSLPAPIMTTMTMGLRTDFMSAQNFQQPPPSFNPNLPPPNFRPPGFDLSRPPPAVQDERPSSDDINVNVGPPQPPDMWNKDPRDMDIDMRSREGMHKNEFDLLSQHPSSGMIKSPGMQQDMGGMQRLSRPPMLGNPNQQGTNAGPLRPERPGADRGFHGHVVGFDQSMNPAMLPRPGGARMMVPGGNMDRNMNRMDRPPALPSLSGIVADRPQHPPLPNMMDGGPNGPPMEMDRARGGIDHAGQSMPPRLMGPIGVPEPRPGVFHGPGMPRFGGPGGPRMPAGPGIGMGPRNQFGRFPGPRPPPGRVGGIQDGFPPRMLPPRGAMFPGNRGPPPFMGGGGGPRLNIDQGNNQERPANFGTDRTGGPPFGGGGGGGGGGPDFHEERFRHENNNDRFNSNSNNNNNDWKRRPRPDDNFRERFPSGNNNDPWIREPRGGDDRNNEFNREREFNSRDRYPRDRDHRERDREREKEMGFDNNPRDREHSNRDREANDRDWNRNNNRDNNRDRRGGGGDDRNNHRDFRDDRNERNRKSRWSEIDRNSNEVSSNFVPIEPKAEKMVDKKPVVVKAEVVDMFEPDAKETPELDDKSFNGPACLPKEEPADDASADVKSEPMDVEESKPEPEPVEEAAA